MVPVVVMMALAAKLHAMRMLSVWGATVALMVTSLEVRLDELGVRVVMMTSNLFHIVHEVLIIHVVKRVDEVALALELVVLVVGHNGMDRVLNVVLLARVALMHALSSLNDVRSVRGPEIWLLGSLVLRLLLLLLLSIRLTLLTLLLSCPSLVLDTSRLRSLGEILLLLLLGGRCSLDGIAVHCLLLLDLLVTASMLLRLLLFDGFLSHRAVLRWSTRSGSPHGLILASLVFLLLRGLSLLLRLL